MQQRPTVEMASRTVFKFFINMSSLSSGQFYHGNSEDIFAVSVWSQQRYLVAVQPSSDAYPFKHQSSSRSKGVLTKTKSWCRQLQKLLLAESREQQTSQLTFWGADAVAPLSAHRLSDAGKVMTILLLQQSLQKKRKT